MRILKTVILAAALAAPLMAEPAYEASSVRVQTADLDLGSAAGQRQLSQRLETALTRLCGTPIFFSRDELAALDACRADAVQAATPQIDAARARRALAVASSR